MHFTNPIADSILDSENESNGLCYVDSLKASFS